MRGNHWAEEREKNKSNEDKEEVAEENEAAANLRFNIFYRRRPSSGGIYIGIYLREYIRLL